MKPEPQPPGDVFDWNEWRQQDELERRSGAAPCSASRTRSAFDIIEGREAYTPLRLAIELDKLAAWVKRNRPDWTPEKIAQEMHEEIERIEEEMMEGSF